MSYLKKKYILGLFLVFCCVTLISTVCFSKEVYLSNRNKTIRVQSGNKVTMHVSEKNIDNCSWYKQECGKWKHISAKRTYTKKFNKCGLFRFKCTYETKEGSYTKYLNTTVYKDKSRVTKQSISNKIDNSAFKGFVEPKLNDGYIHVFIADKNYTHPILKAIKKLNSISGKFFVHTTDIQEAELIITSFNPYKRSAIGSKYFRNNDLEECFNHLNWRAVALSTDGLSLHYMIAINSHSLPTRHKVTYLALIHELCHCINIGHSTEANSLMNSCISSSYVLTKSDRKNIKNRIKKYRDFIKEIR